METIDSESCVQSETQTEKCHPIKGSATFRPISLTDSVTFFHIANLINILFSIEVFCTDGYSQIGVFD